MQSQVNQASLVKWVSTLIVNKMYLKGVLNIVVNGKKRAKFNLSLSMQF